MNALSVIESANLFVMMLVKWGYPFGVDAIVIRESFISSCILCDDLMNSGNAFLNNAGLFVLMSLENCGGVGFPLSVVSVVEPNE